MNFNQVTRIARAEVTHATQSVKEMFSGFGENITSSIRVDMSNAKQMVSDWFAVKYAREMRAHEVIEKYQHMVEPRTKKEQLERRVQMLTELRNVGAFDGGMSHLSPDEVVKYYIDTVMHIRKMKAEMFALVEKKINRKHATKFLSGTTANRMYF